MAVVMRSCSYSLISSFQKDLQGLECGLAVQSTLHGQGPEFNPRAMGVGTT